MRRNANFLHIPILLVLGCAALLPQSGNAQEEKNKKLALDWWRYVVAGGKVDSAPKYMADNYIEHDPNIGGGRKEFLEYYGRASLRPNANAKPVMSFGKGDYVVLVWEHDDKDQTGKPI